MIEPGEEPVIELPRDLDYPIVAIGDLMRGGRNWCLFRFSSRPPTARPARRRLADRPAGPPGWWGDRRTKGLCSSLVQRSESLAAIRRSRRERGVERRPRL